MRRKIRYRSRPPIEETRITINKFYNKQRVNEIQHKIQEIVSRVQKMNP